MNRSKKIAALTSVSTWPRFRSKRKHTKDTLPPARRRICGDGSWTETSETLLEKLMWVCKSSTARTLSPSALRRQESVHSMLSATARLASLALQCTVEASACWKTTPNSTLQGDSMATGQEGNILPWSSSLREENTAIVTCGMKRAKRR